MELVQAYKTLADESRLRILKLLLTGRFSVNELTDILRMGQSRVSRHLKLLLDAGFVTVQREGTWAYYEAARQSSSPIVHPQFTIVKNCAESIEHTQQDEQRRLRCLEARRQKSKSFHEKVGTNWSLLRKQLFGDAPITQRIKEHIADTWRRGKRKPIITDLGCGSGELLGALVAQAHKVIGIDNSQVMLEQAKHSIDSQYSDKIELRLGMLEHLPLADGEADLAILNLVLHHLAEPQVVLREVWRTLNTSGQLLICDLLQHDQEWMREKYGDLWLGFTKTQLGTILDQTGFALTKTQTFHDTPRFSILLAAAKRQE